MWVHIVSLLGRNPINITEAFTSVVESVDKTYNPRVIKATVTIFYTKDPQIKTKILPVLNKIFEISYRMGISPGELVLNLFTFGPGSSEILDRRGFLLSSTLVLAPGVEDVFIYPYPENVAKRELLKLIGYIHKLPHEVYTEVYNYVGSKGNLFNFIPRDKWDEYERDLDKINDYFDKIYDAYRNKLKEEGRWLRHEDFLYFKERGKSGKKTKDVLKKESPSIRKQRIHRVQHRM